MIKATTSAMVMVQPTAKTIINIVFSLEDDISKGREKESGRRRKGGQGRRRRHDAEGTDRCWYHRAGEGWVKDEEVDK